MLVERDFNFYMDFLKDIVKSDDVDEKEHIQKTYLRLFNTRFTQ